MQFHLPLIPVTIIVQAEWRPRPAPRLRCTVRGLMIAVAVPALLLGGYMRILDSDSWSQDYRRQVSHHARWEAYHRSMVQIASESGSPKEVARHAAEADRRRELKRKWEWGLWQPWRTVQMDAGERHHSFEGEPPL